jgi:hypothetical protein
MTDPIDILEATHIPVEFDGSVNMPGLYVIEIQKQGNKLLRAVYSVDLCGDGEKCALFNAGCAAFGSSWMCGDIKFKEL